MDRSPSKGGCLTNDHDVARTRCITLPVKEVNNLSLGKNLERRTLRIAFLLQLVQELLQHHQLNDTVQILLREMKQMHMTYPTTEEWFTMYQDAHLPLLKNKKRHHQTNEQSIASLEYMLDFFLDEYKPMKQSIPSKQLHSQPPIKSLNSLPNSITTDEDHTVEPTKKPKKLFKVRRFKIKEIRLPPISLNETSPREKFHVKETEETKGHEPMLRTSASVDLFMPSHVDKESKDKKHPKHRKKKTLNKSSTDLNGTSSNLTSTAVGPEYARDSSTQMFANLSSLDDKVHAILSRQTKEQFDREDGKVDTGDILKYSVETKAHLDKNSRSFRREYKEFLQQQQKRIRSNIRPTNSTFTETLPEVVDFQKDKFSKDKQSMLMCALCQREYSLINLPLSISFKAIMDLYKKWKYNPPDSQNAKYKPPLCYDQVCVCLFCSQLVKAQRKTPSRRVRKAPSPSSPRHHTFEHPGDGSNTQVHFPSPSTTITKEALPIDAAADPWLACVLGEAPFGPDRKQPTTTTKQHQHQHPQHPHQRNVRHENKNNSESDDENLSQDDKEDSDECSSDDESFRRDAVAGKKGKNLQYSAQKLATDAFLTVKEWNIVTGLGEQSELKDAMHKVLDAINTQPKKKETCKPKAGFQNN